VLIDARSQPVGGTVDADVVIVGAGPAGLAIAQELADQGVASVLVEAGGERFSAKSQRHYEGEVAELSYDLMRTRTRQFGGSSHCWAGWCRPFSEQDLARRDWIPNSGWPIAREALEPYFGRAGQFLGISPGSTSHEDWRAHGEACGAPLIPVRAADGLENVISHLSQPVRFGRAHLRTLVAKPLVRVFLHATVCHIETDEDCRHATAVAVQTVADRRFRITAKQVVLAAGGIENARLLLLSNQRRSVGLGNELDVVGRYFMDHPRLRMGRLHLHAERAGRFYDVAYYYGNKSFRSGGVLPAATLALTPEVQRAEGATQCHMGLIASYPFESAAVTEATKLVYRTMRNSRLPLAPVALLRGVPGVLPTSMAWALRRVRSRALVRSFVVQSVLEPTPDPENRVTLASGRDAFGQQRTHLRWRVGELERRSHLLALQRLGMLVQQRGLGWLEVDADNWFGRVETTWHHMGTTRMHQDPRFGVVDTNCRVHGMSNLFIAGSSVFTSGGGNMPTLNLVALAFRLAGHLAQQRAWSRPAAGGAASAAADPVPMQEAAGGGHLRRTNA
jgi:choline dehydrogenase-like flavoprotein